MTELKLQTLIDRGACDDQVDLFRARYGESVDVTPELCEEVADDFAFEWAAEKLLIPTTHEEYARVRGAALAEYWRVRDAAYAEYERVIAREFARQYIAQGGGGMNIQRYDLEPGSESMQRFPDGDYILYTDHLEAVKQASSDALRLVLEQMTDSAPNAVCSGDAGFDMQCGGIIAERARLRALIEKEIEK